MCAVLAFAASWCFDEAFARRQVRRAARAPLVAGSLALLIVLGWLGYAIARHSGAEYFWPVLGGFNVGVAVRNLASPRPMRAALFLIAGVAFLGLGIAAGAGRI